MPGDPEGRFRSHNGYIQALGWIGGKERAILNDVALERLATKAHASTELTDARPPAIDKAQVHKSLRNAWSTEVLLALPAEWAKDEDEFIRLSNTWGVVQAYYASYHQTQALWVSKGNARPDTHPKTQKLYADLWVNRPCEFTPWSFGASDSGWKNLPIGQTIEHVHPWEACNRENCWSLAAQVLKSTRDDAVKKARERKRDEGQRDRKRAWDLEEQNRIALGKQPRRPKVFARPQLTTAEKTACDQRVRTHTILDYFFRLRIGANYDDSAVFVEGPQNEADSYLLHRRLNYLVSGLAMLTDFRIRRLVGKAIFDRWAGDFSSNSIPSSNIVGIKERLPMLQP